MTSSELQEILGDKSKKLSVEELKEVISQIQRDFQNEDNKLLRKMKSNSKNIQYANQTGFYNGAISAFQIALDLLEHLED